MSRAVLNPEQFFTDWTPDSIGSKAIENARPPQHEVDALWDKIPTAQDIR